ncbi:MAG: MamI family restriction endonuclease, partial [Pseudonocardiaceae bacterium]
VLGEPGQGFKGKGLDLLDGTEVKSAAILSGVDRPRWNHNLGTIAQDKKRKDKGLPTISDEYLASPTVFYLLFDRVVDEDAGALVLRVRAWCLDGPADAAWRDLLIRYVAQRGVSQYNLQLHPPVGYDDDLVVNTLGNLDFAEVKVLDARISGLADPGDFRIEWKLAPTFPVRPVRGRSIARPYERDKGRASRLAVAADVVPDMAVLVELLPELGPERIAQLAAAFQREATLAAIDESDPEEGLE